ncbi:hypothetical protein AVEN_46850-1 [Araneus ventricosus]|uniref:STPR domain-containing protein n=1 Tax=Araneus ventricosus TaxID=182803 RepID=A0A4Y2CM97_ARAVE|nr:hypothetical protein AVEN_46850-1 [Araneus ventricosus]
MASPPRTRGALSGGKVGGSHNGVTPPNNQPPFSWWYDLPFRKGQFKCPGTETGSCPLEDNNCCANVISEVPNMWYAKDRLVVREFQVVNGGNKKKVTIFALFNSRFFRCLKEKRGITGDAASRREAIRKRERRVVETEEERNRRLSTMAQRDQDRKAEETEEQRNSRLSDMAQRGKERRTEETEEQRNSRLSDMAQRGQERRAEETEEQRNRRLAVMRQRSQQRRAEETEEQRKENTFWAEHNVYVSDNICKKK